MQARLEDVTMRDARELATQDGPLVIRGMTVAYDRKPAVFSVDATFRPGRITGIIGPNGAGKSTLLRAALGIVKPLAGQATFFGTTLSRSRDRVAYVPQRASVDWDFPARVVDVVAQGLYRRLGLLGRFGRDHDDMVKAALERVGMEDFSARQIGQLSGGQQQRVFLARALAQDAMLYLLDEPFAGVDAATERAIIKVLKALRSEGRTVIAVHHDLSTVEEYFDDVLVMNVRKISDGPVGTAFTPEALDTAYGGRLEQGTRDPQKALA